MTDSAQNSKQILAQKGTAATPSFSFLGGNATGIYSAGTNQLGFSTAGAVAAVIDASGNVGIGTTSPAAQLEVSRAGSSEIRATTTTSAGNVAVVKVKGPVSNYGIFTVDNANYLAFYDYTANAERMRLDSSGNLLVGTASGASKLTLASTSGASPIAYFINNTGSGNQAGLQLTLGSTANNTSSYHFGGVTTGASAWYLLGNGTTTYTSDERRKKNITTTRDGYLEDICKLRVVKYQWKSNADDSPAELGLIAQEVETVFPGLVQDDLTPSDDGITYKTMKGSVLTYMLIKAVQELSAKNDALEARLATLENVQ